MKTTATSAKLNVECFKLSLEFYPFNNSAPDCAALVYQTRRRAKTGGPPPQ